MFMLMFKYKKFLTKEIVRKLCDVIVIGVIFANDDEEIYSVMMVLN
jgi:hypothetical protein